MKKPSLRKAINQQCKDCIYDPHGGYGNWRQQVEACTCPSCSLFPVRPTSSPKKDKEAVTEPENGQNDTGTE